MPADFLDPNRTEDSPLKQIVEEEAEKLAEQTLAALTAGKATFEDLARKYYDDERTKDRGGSCIRPLPFRTLDGEPSAGRMVP